MSDGVLVCWMMYGWCRTIAHNQQVKVTCNYSKYCTCSNDGSTSVSSDWGDDWVQRSFCFSFSLFVCVGAWWVELKQMASRVCIVFYDVLSPPHTARAVKMLWWWQLNANMSQHAGGFFCRPWCSCCTGLSCSLLGCSVWCICRSRWAAFCGRLALPLCGCGQDNWRTCPYTPSGPACVDAVEGVEQESVGLLTVSDRLHFNLLQDHRCSSVICSSSVKQSPRG